jgi:hypothetical protein
MATLTIDCDGCIMQGTDACGDCVVSFICGREDDNKVVIAPSEERVLGLLERGGLVPPIRHYRRAAASR